MNNAYAHTCDTARATSTTDAYRNEKRTWSANLSGQPCRYKEVSRRGFNSVTAEWVITSEYRLFVPFGTDIEVGDRVTRVAFEDGTEITDEFKVVSRLQRRGHGLRHETLIMEKVQ